MAFLNQAKIIKALEAATAGPRADFIYGFLRAYGTPASTVKLLQLGDGLRNVASVPGDVAVKDRIWFRATVPGSDLQKAADGICGLPALKIQKIRFILVTDFDRALGVDLKVGDQISFDFADFKAQYEFFLPLTGLYEKPIAYSEHPADVKACEKMGRLYDGIRAFNKYEGEEDRHALNLFLVRLLFCFFAEDTGIFPVPNMMTDALQTCTRCDGADLALFFRSLFEVLDMPPDAPGRAKLPAVFRKFPYVGGSLFAEKIRIPEFSALTRARLLDCGRLSWRKISPLIFGAMFQAVMDPAERRTLGFYATSECDAMKVLGPLFLDGLREKLDWILLSPDGLDRKCRLEEFRDGLGRLRFLDPCCGSGGFLIIAYRELRRLEIRCMAALKDLTPGARMLALNAVMNVKVHIGHFHGIEILDFPADVARVSLYLTEHVMNLEMEKEFDAVYPMLPFRHTPGIVCADALVLPWDAVAGPEGVDFVFGSLPCLGASMQSREQKERLGAVFRGRDGARSLDCAAGWFELASRLMLKHPRMKAGFIATNSLCQGEQAAAMWGPILDRGQEIFFAHQPFRPDSGRREAPAADSIAAGFCASAAAPRQKRLFRCSAPSPEAPAEFRCEAISPYLTEGRTPLVHPSLKPLSAPRPMVCGCRLDDGGALIVEDEDLEDFRRREPGAVPWLRRLVGARELLHGLPRHCLWLKDAPEEVLRLPLVAERVERCRRARLTSPNASARRLSARASEFGTPARSDAALAVPVVSSERRPYIPMTFVDGNAVITDSCRLVPGAGLWEFG
ncbi:MAG: hypothetical protein K6E40_13290, partial [Desulfovibrio sp.]|nr:hypothetical protein [Desulfovibrio sp.]